MQRLITIIMFMVVFCGQAYAEVISLTLDEAIALALRNNIDVLLKEEELSKAKIKISEAQAALFPTLNLTAGWAETRGYYPKDIGQYSTQTTLKQYLYRGGKTTASVAQNEYKSAVAHALLDKTKSDTILNVKKAFYTLLLADELSSLNLALWQNSQDHRESFIVRYKHGEVSEEDLFKLETSISQVKQAYATALYQAQSLRALLNNLLHLEEQVRILPKAEFNYTRKDAAYDAALLKALRERPEIRQYEAEEAANKKAVAIARADSRPQVFASWDYYSRSTTSLTFSPTKNWQDYNVAGITISWPIFDGWLTRAKVEEAASDLKNSRLLKQKNIADIALELKNAYLGLNNALIALDRADMDFIFYARNRQTAEEKYKQGQISKLDQEDADLKQNISSFNKKQAIYDYIIAGNIFDQAAGGLNP